MDLESPTARAPQVPKRQAAGPFTAWLIGAFAGILSAALSLLFLRGLRGEALLLPYVAIAAIVGAGIAKLASRLPGRILPFLIALAATAPVVFLLFALVGLLAAFLFLASCGGGPCY